MSRELYEIEEEEVKDDVRDEGESSVLETGGVQTSVPGDRASADPASVAAEAETQRGVEPLSATEETDPAEEVGTVPPEKRERANAWALLREELSEFRTLYPEVELSSIPAEVTESTLPLSAAYALYLRRRDRLRLSAEEENRRNSGRSPGGVRDGADGAYTPDEVRRMTRDEIRKNYDAVISSMKRWG